MSKKRHINKLRVSITILIMAAIALSSSIIIPKILEKNKQQTVFESKVITEIDPNKVHIEYPTTNVEVIDTFIETLVHDNLKAFKQEAQDVGSGSEFNIKYDYKLLDDHIVTFKFESYSYFSKAANGSSKVTTLTFDMNNGNFIKLADLFETELDYRSFLDTLKKSVKSIVSNSEDTIDFLNDQEITEVVNSIEDFDIDESSINIYFDKYDIAPGYKGAQTVSLSLDQVKGIKYEAIRDGDVLGIKPDEEYKRVLKEREENYYRGKKLVALTFDDGPSVKITSKFLEILKKEEVPATFFWLGQNIERFPDIVKRAHQEGHQIASHTFSHFDLKRLDIEKYTEEINNTEAALNKIGIDSKGFMRPPYGSFNKEILTNTQSIAILWNVDSQDWSLKDSTKITKEVLSTVNDGSIVLMHDIYNESAESLESIIPELKKEGYEFVTVEKLLQLRGGYERGEAYYNAKKS